MPVMAAMSAAVAGRRIAWDFTLASLGVAASQN
jgi:hypothetical protein